MNFVAGESNKLTPPERHHKPSLGSSTPTSGSSQPTVINILPSTSAAAAAATYSFAGQASSTTAAEDPEDLDNIVNPVITDHMLYLFATFDNKIDVGRLKRNIQFLERPAHLDEMMNGKINLLPSLTVFVNHPFVIHFDEYHLKHMPYLRTPSDEGDVKMRALAFSASNIDGSNFRFVYIRVESNNFIQ
ncbi:uncharacterized protein LOC121404047 [Drosophila obscura]|uniref:uncharacterized protein LOC121404047 n=1 Tax=Drosophila obscura TaxID=7282 RepID=UPI001BB0DAC7|nr:uncharacterized protein LOC121404047 [Drosophila obscura]